MNISAEASLYPLRTKSIDEPISRFCRILEGRDLRIETGNMSTIISGETEAVFDALKTAMTEIGEESDIVLVVKLSNACPSCDVQDE